jgi:uncharacterized FlaG/YvyC family protein
MGGYSPSGRWKRKTLGRKGKKALTALAPDDHGELMAQVHRDSDSLRRFGESLKKKKGFSKDSKAQFELDPETGMIFLKIFDAETGELQLVMTPEEVAKSLRDLEEAEDNAAPLSSFFLDVTV